MTAWWQERTARERGLVIALMATLLLYALVFGVVAPLRSGRESAAADLAAAERVLSDVRAAAAARSVDAAPGAVVGGTVREVVVRTARARGVGITRLTPAEGEGLTVRMDRVEARQFHAWLDTLRTDAGITVRQAVIRRLEAGLVSVDVTLARGGS